MGVQTKPHPLPGKLVVSLTSYGPRFATLQPTLECLLLQTMKPDHVILWIGHKDLEKIPAGIKALEARGLEIRTTDDIGPFTKIIPALRAFPDAYVVTADDDIYYAPDWLESLLKSWDGAEKQIVCHRAHRVIVNENGMPMPYNKWEWNITEGGDTRSIFPTGVGGVFYPKGLLANDEVTNKDVFLKLCPKADDLWLYWMGRKHGATYKLTNSHKHVIVWPSSQKVTLGSTNVEESANDWQIRNLIDAYGCPDFGRA